MSGSVATPAVSVVIPARDAASTLPRTLDGLQAQDLREPFEIIVVDDGSNDDTASIAERHPSEPRVIKRDRGRGAGGARNEGVSASRAPILAFIDADCVPAPAWLSEGLRAISAVDLVAGEVRPPPGVPVGPFDRTVWVLREHGLYETANIFVRREWFDRVGGFNDWAPRAGSGGTNRPFGEDAWFAWSARRLGARTTFEPRAVVHHAVFPGRALAHVKEQWRLRHFPALVARIPELRDVFLWGRWFLNARTAAFDAAVVGAIAATSLRSLLPLALLVPYGVQAGREVWRWGWRGRETARLGLALAARDAVGFAGLLTGSVRARTIVL